MAPFSIATRSPTADNFLNPLESLAADYSELFWQLYFDPVFSRAHRRAAFFARSTKAFVTGQVAGNSLAVMPDAGIGLIPEDPYHAVITPSFSPFRLYVHLIE